MKPYRATEFYRPEIAPHCASKRRGEGVLRPTAALWKEVPQRGSTQKR